MTRGICLNNPACIRLSSLNRWKGLSKVQKDKEFCTFDSVQFSIRALIIILRRYTYHYGLISVREIISRYAPAFENITDSYILFVSSRFSHPDKLILFDGWKVPTNECFVLCKAICCVESGYVLPKSVFDASVKLL